MITPDQEQWLRVRGRLRAEVGEDIFSSWFARMELDGLDEETVHLSVPTRFLKSWIQAHYAERVLVCWRGEQPNLRRIDLAVRSAVIRSAVPPKCVEPAAAPPRNGRDAKFDGIEMRPATAPIVAAHEALGGSPLDARLTFDSFVVGRSNTLAHAAAKQVADARRGDAVMFNPLYIHAGVGLGKTHLLQAIAWAGNRHSDRKVLYLTAERFVYGFVSALRSQTAIAFKEALRGIDVLVIDDLQFLQGKSTQAEFSHTLNSLIDAGRQVVIAADRPPADIENLDERVRSRLAGGLVVEMGMLAEELRLQILVSRVAAARQHHPGLRGFSAHPRPYRPLGDAERARSGRRHQPPARPLQAHRTAGHHGTGRARDPRPHPAAPSRAGSRSRKSSASSPATTMSAAATFCRRAAPPTWCGRARSPCTSPRS